MSPQERESLLGQLRRELGLGGGGGGERSRSMHDLTGGGGGDEGGRGKGLQELLGRGPRLPPAPPHRSLGDIREKRGGRGEGGGKGSRG